MGARDGDVVPGLLDAALEYASHGWPVFPLDGKDPRTSHGFYDATTDTATIQAWWTRWPDANIGLPTGEDTAVVVDIDGPGAEMALQGHDLATTTAKTAKGQHLYFAWSEGCGELRNWTEILPDVDIRTTGGYVVAPPSIHPDTGERYEWITAPPWDEPPKPFPRGLADHIIGAKARRPQGKSSGEAGPHARAAVEGHPYALAAFADEIATLRACSEGERNDTLNRAAFALFGLVKGGHLDRAKTWDELEKAAKSTGLERGEITKTLESAWSGAKAREIPDDRFEEGTKCGSTSIPTRLVNLVLENGAELWKSEEGEPFITIINDGHRENHPLESKHVKTWLSKLFYQSEGGTPKGTAIDDAISTLKGMALFDAPSYRVFTRVAGQGDLIYLDLGGSDWRAVGISAAGWRAISSEEVPRGVRFRRPKGMLELPEPATGGNLEDLRGILNIPDGGPWILALAWLLQAFNPTGPYPILCLNGEQGCGKSWTSRGLRYLVDPNKAPLKRPPRSERDLMIAAVNSWVVAYDNLSGLPPWLGDAICVLSTGGGLSQRALYTDADEAILDAQRPVILNGIDSITTRGDLLDRAIILSLPTIPATGRRTEREIMAELDRIRPGVLGALLDAVSHGLGELPKVDLPEKPRLADFAEWVTACEGAMGWEPGAFLEAFVKNQEDAQDSLIYNDLFATSLLEFALSLEEPYEDLPSSLLNILEARSNINPSFPPNGWPRTARGASDKIRRLAPALRTAGVEVEFKPRTKQGCPILLSRRTPRTPTYTKKPAAGVCGVHGVCHFTSLPLEERKEKEEEGGGAGRKVCKQRTPHTPHTPDTDFEVYVGVRGVQRWEEQFAPSCDTEVFGHTISFYNNLAAQHDGGLTVQQLQNVTGWPAEKAAMVLDTVGWPKEDPGNFEPVVYRPRIFGRPITDYLDVARTYCNVLTPERLGPGIDLSIVDAAAALDELVARFGWTDTDGVYRPPGAEPGTPAGICEKCGGPRYGDFGRPVCHACFTGRTPAMPEVETDELQTALPVEAVA